MTESVSIEAYWDEVNDMFATGILKEHKADQWERKPRFRPERNESIPVLKWIASIAEQSRNEDIRIGKKYFKIHCWLWRETISDLRCL